MGRPAFFLTSQGQTMNLKVKPGHQVNHHLEGTVLSESHIEGGENEVFRLHRLGVVEFVDEPVTVTAPLSASAVAEMDDDELIKENQRLRTKILGHNNDAEFFQNEISERDAKIAELLAKLEAANATTVQTTPVEPEQPPAADPQPAPAAPASQTEPVKNATRKK